MSNKISMTPNEMRELSKKFHYKSESVKQILNSLDKEVGSLSNIWEGEAKKAFTNKFNIDKRKLNDLSYKLDVISKNLITITTKIEELDRQLESRI